jgi:pSer/pThr/pTyr-binding forkhead associated (FHA) protein
MRPSYDSRPGAIMVTLTCPACAAEVKPGDLICFTCGANLPRTRSADEDPPAPATIMQEYLKREETTGSIALTVLRIAFPTGNVEVPAGTSLLLGRDPQESLVAAAFSGFENVSRRHATVTVDDHGHATIRDENSTNGTFVNGDRVLPGTAVRLADGDLVRLAADVTGEVLLPRQEADPASLSREPANGHDAVTGHSDAVNGHHEPR